MHFFDEIEGHDYVADDNVDQAGDSRNTMKPKGEGVSEAHQRGHHTVESGCESQQRSHHVTKLELQRPINSEHRDGDNASQICDSGLLLRPLPISMR